MIDQERIQQLKTGQIAAGVVPSLAGLDEDQLLELRSKIDNMLPPQTLSNMNLEYELVAQFKAVKRLQETVLEDDRVQANQKAQVAGQVASTLGQLVKMQVDLQRDETFKILEACLIESIKVLPDDVKNEFMSEYERRIAKARAA